jgi:hypothetical protein
LAGNAAELALLSIRAFGVDRSGSEVYAAAYSEVPRHIMLRFVIRVVALFALAAGFAVLIIDGTRSIAANQIIWTRFGETCATFLPKQFPLIQPAIQRLSPFLWDPVLKDFFILPTWLVLTVFGTILFWLARRRQPKIGYSSRP